MDLTYLGGYFDARGSIWIPEPEQTKGGGIQVFLTASRRGQEDNAHFRDVIVPQFQLLAENSGFYKNSQKKMTIFKSAQEEGQPEKGDGRASLSVSFAGNAALRLLAKISPFAPGKLGLIRATVQKEYNRRVSLTEPYRGKALEKFREIWGEPIQ